jgi:hypothetical protein
VADECHPSEPFDVLEDGGHAVIERNRRQVRRPPTAAGQVNGDDGLVEERENWGPAR